DTAGLRASPDPIEREGMARAHAAMERADRVLLVPDDAARDDAQELAALLPPGVRCTRVYNKSDLTGRAPGKLVPGGEAAIALSAKTGAGLDSLRAHLKECVGFAPAGEGGFIARRRHLEALARARALVARGREQLATQRAGELLPEDLRAAQRALGEITGEFTPDDLLGRIFASFCIGK